MAAYGSGVPAWGRGGDVEDGVPARRPNSNSGNSGGGSYQRGDNSGGGGGSYQPPRQQGTTTTYAEQQTRVVEDSLRTHVQAETTANNVLDRMVQQRQQLQNANEDTWAMRTNVATAQRELREMQDKAWRKKRRLYGIIGALATVDLLLFLRIVQCGGSFFCRRY